MKWIVILLLIAVGVWAYFNVDFNGVKNNAQENTMNAIKNEKTIFHIVICSWLIIK